MKGETMERQKFEFYVELSTLRLVVHNGKNALKPSDIKDTFTVSAKDSNSAMIMLRSAILEEYSKDNIYVIINRIVLLSSDTPKTDIKLGVKII